MPQAAGEAERQTHASMLKPRVGRLTINHVGQRTVKTLCNENGNDTELRSEWLVHKKFALKLPLKLVKLS